MKKILVFMLVMSIMIAGCGLNDKGDFLDNGDNNSKQAMDSDVAAIINGEEISQEYLDKQYDVISQRFEMYGMQISKMQVLEEAIIPQVILVQEAKKEKIKVTNKEVNEYVDNSMKQITESLSEEELQAELDNLGITLEDLEQDNKDAYRIQLYIQRLLNETIWSDIGVDEDEARDYYDNNPEQFDMGEQVRASHILVNTSDEADDILEALDDDEIFEDLAMEFSLDPGSAANGGDLGYFSKGMMVPEFEETAFSADVGSISEPVKTDYGYHIIKVTAKKASGKIKFDDVKDQIVEQLFAAKKQAAEETYVSQLTSDVEIEIFIEDDTPETEEITLE